MTERPMAEHAENELDGPSRVWAPLACAPCGLGLDMDPTLQDDSWPSAPVISSVISQLAAEANAADPTADPTKPTPNAREQSLLSLDSAADERAADERAAELPAAGHVRLMAKAVDPTLSSPEPASAATMGAQAALMSEIQQQQQQQESGASRAFVEPRTSSREALLFEIQKQQRVASKHAVQEPVINSRGALLVDIQKAARARSPLLDAVLEPERTVQALRIRFDATEEPEEGAPDAEHEQLAPRTGSIAEPEPEPEPESESVSRHATVVAQFDREGQLGLNYGARWPYIQSIKPGSLGAQIVGLTVGCRLLSINGVSVEGKALKDTKATVKNRPVQLTFEKPRREGDASPKHATPPKRVHRRLNGEPVRAVVDSGLSPPLRSTAARATPVVGSPSSMAAARRTSADSSPSAYRNPASPPILRHTRGASRSLARRPPARE